MDFARVLDNDRGQMYICLDCCDTCKRARAIVALAIVQALIEF
jgi:hypothetical protein